MAYQGVPKMSLVAQYDDLCRYTKVLTSGPEEEFKIFVENQLNCVCKWKETQSDVKKFLDKISRLEDEKKRYETQIKHLRNLCEAEIEKRRRVESEKRSMERQIAIIKEVLLADGVMDGQTKEKLGFLNSTFKPNINSAPCLETIDEPESLASLLSLSDITEDDLEDTKHSSRRRTRRSKGRHSSSESRLSSKQKKHKTEELQNDVTENISEAYKASEIHSNNEPASKSPEIPAGFHPGCKSDSNVSESATYDLQRYNTGGLSGSTPIGRNSGRFNRTHSFVQKVIIKAEKCNPCGKRIKFCQHALKCQDCRVICHPECKDQCPVPCVPAVNTRTKGVPGTIADYAPAVAPMIPSIIVHCVNEIESRGLKEIGLYRISGSDRDVKDMKEKFLKGRTVPCLNQVNVHVVCGIIKEFLRSLKEPLVTHYAWQSFVDAAELNNAYLSLNAMYENVMELPQPNRDTLSFLILHLQRVAKSCECKMPIDNLANIFGPTIVGYSMSNPSDTRMFSETSYQYKVMQCLLSIPPDSWQSSLNFEADLFLSKGIKTPESIPAPKGSRLGPLYPPKQSTRITYTGRNPFTPRNSRRKMPFTSPFNK